MNDEPGPSYPNRIQERFHGLPILVVVLKHAGTDEVLGILLPYGGVSLEALTEGYKFGMGCAEGEGVQDEKAGANDNDNDVIDSSKKLQPLPLSLTETHFQGLVNAIWELALAGVLHNDINDGNTLLTPDNCLALVDLGEIAPEYKGDAHALSSMILWVLDHVDWKVEVVRRVRRISMCLCHV